MQAIEKLVNGFNRVNDALDLENLRASPDDSPGILGTVLNNAMTAVFEVVAAGPAQATIGGCKVFIGGIWTVVKTFEALGFLRAEGT